MTTYQILCLIGVPGFIGTLVGCVIAYFKSQKALKLGMQAILRSEMIKEWNKWSDKGYAPIYARENFENCWLQYHQLGANGVMNDIYEKFLDLPIK